MRKKIFPIAVALAVSAMFIVPGIAFGSGGGTPSPPPSNPPCDADGHGGSPPPYAGPNLNSGSCDNGTGSATGGTTGDDTGSATGDACPPNSHNPDGTPPDCGHGTTGTTTGDTTGTTTGDTTTTTGDTTTTTTTGGAINQCTWDVTIAGTEVLPDTFVEGAIGVHADVAPDAVEHPDAPIGLVHACLGIGSIVVPEGGGQCPTGTVPIEAQTDQASFLLLCVLL
jgi:hypothetical protein